MNLWVKRTGQLLVAVLFLMSCEDDSFLLGFRNQNQKLNIRYQEFHLPSSVVLIDSIPTDNSAFGETYRLLVGNYTDSRFGTVRAEAYTQLQPANSVPLPAGSMYDSITIQLRLDLYSYGAEGENIERFTIHEITEDSLTYTRRYYYNSSIGINNPAEDYDPFSLGEAALNVNYDTLQKYASQGGSADTLMFRLRLHDSFGTKLFNIALNNTDSSFSKNKKFKNEIKGLAFIPEQSDRIVGINPGTLVSKVILHYHTPTQDSLFREFRIIPGAAISFNKFSTDRTGDLAGMTETFTGYEPPSGYRYLQNGSPVITKLDISSFYDFITGKVDGETDSLTNIIINSAEITLEVEAPPPGTEPPSTLEFKIMKSNDHFSAVGTADSIGMAKLHVLQDSRYYYPLFDNVGSEPAAVSVQYNSSTKKYSGFVTLFMQSLFTQKERDRIHGVENPIQIKYLGLIPFSPSPGKSVGRAVIIPNSIKLKLNYTSPVIINQ